MSSVATAKSGAGRAVHAQSGRLRALSRSLAYHGFMIGFGFVMLYPLLWLCGSSLKGPSEIWTNLAALIPKAPTVENYLHGWAGFGGVTFTTFYKNSFVYASGPSSRWPRRRSSRSALPVFGSWAGGSGSGR